MSAAVTQDRRWLWRVLRVAVSLVLVAVLARAVGGAEIAARLGQVQPLWIAAAIAALLVQTALSAQRWRVTARGLGQRLPAGLALREYLLSQAVNQALPGAVMGDATRAVRARESGGLLVASQAVIFERLAGQIAMFVTLVVAFLSTHLVAGGLDWPPGLAAGLSVVSGLGAAALLGALALSVLPAGRAARWMQPLCAGLFSREVRGAQVGLGAAITLCNLAGFGFAARAVGVELSAVEVAALVPVILFAMLVPLTVSGWGVREGAAALILPVAGVPVADSIAASIAFGIALLVAVLPGAIVVLLR